MSPERQIDEAATPPKQAQTANTATPAFCTTSAPMWRHSLCTCNCVLSNDHIDLPQTLLSSVCQAIKLGDYQQERLQRVEAQEPRTVTEYISAVTVTEYINAVEIRGKLELLLGGGKGTILR